MLQATAEFDRQQRHIATAALIAARRVWAKMGSDFDTSWARLQPQLVVLTSAAQLAAAKSGGAYVPSALAETDTDPDMDGEFVPRSLAGVASDGRGLGTLLYGSVTKSKQAVGAGATAREALQLGGAWLHMAVDTMVTDAGRVAAGVQIAQSRGASGYVRVERAGCCSRCALLSGAFYRWSAGFERHPGCRGRNEPVGTPAAARAAESSPRALFDALSRAEQDRTYTKAGAQAIRDGADMGQVVNARRGMSAAGESKTRVNAAGRVVNERHQTFKGTTTTTGTTRRGSAAKYLDGRQRLMPEEIYRLAGGDRDAAVRGLYANGYLT